MPLDKTVLKKKPKKASIAPEPEARALLPVLSQPAAARPDEVCMHELCESLAISAVSIRRELQRYPDEMGIFSLDDFELEIPAKIRIDELGQTMTKVVSEASPNDTIARIKLRIKPVPGPLEMQPVISDQPLETLDVLSREQIAKFESYRIFSVEDLLRASRSVANRKALAGIIPEAKLGEALDRAGVAAMPGIPEGVSRKLLELKIKSPRDFVARDAEEMAKSLSHATGENIEAKDVIDWQKQIRNLISIKKIRRKTDLSTRPADNVIINVGDKTA